MSAGYRRDHDIQIASIPVSEELDAIATLESMGHIVRTTTKLVILHRELTWLPTSALSTIFLHTPSTNNFLRVAASRGRLATLSTSITVTGTLFFEGRDFEGRDLEDGIWIIQQTLRGSASIFYVKHPIQRQPTSSSMRFLEGVTIAAELKTAAGLATTGLYTFNPTSVTKIMEFTIHGNRHLQRRTPGHQYRRYSTSERPRRTPRGPRWPRLRLRLALGAHFLFEPGRYAKTGHQHLGNADSHLN
jgi:hypothetical protein